MNLIIKGMEMPKQTEVQTDKGTKKLWTIRNWKVSQDEQFGAAEIPCYLSFNHDGTIHLSVLGRKYSLTDVPTPHGRLIDADRLIAVLKSTTAISQSDYDLFNHIVGLTEHQPTVIEAEG